MEGGFKDSLDGIERGAHVHCIYDIFERRIFPTSPTKREIYTSFLGAGFINVFLGICSLSHAPHTVLLERTEKTFTTHKIRSIHKC